MPEDKPVSGSSGDMPREPKKTLRPHIIAGEAHTPSKQPLRPSVVRSGETSDQNTPVTSKLQRIVPAIIRSNDEQTFAAHPAEVDGVPRKRIPVTREALRTFAPAKDAVLERAEALIHGTVAETLDNASCLLWAKHSQEAYVKLVECTLTLSQSPMLSTALRRLGRLGDIFASIDLRLVLDADDGLLSHVMSKSFDSILRDLRKKQAEIQDIVKLLRQTSGNLLKLKAELEAVKSDLSSLEDEIDASAIGAAFLADYFKTAGGNPSFAEIFLSRERSLIATSAQIRESELLSSMQITQPLNLINAIENVVLIMVPSFLGAYASLGSMLERKDKPTVTEVDEIGRQLKTIQEKLHL